MKFDILIAQILNETHSNTFKIAEDGGRHIYMLSMRATAPYGSNCCESPKRLRDSLADLLFNESANWDDDVVYYDGDSYSQMIEYVKYYFEVNMDMIKEVAEHDIAENDDAEDGVESIDELIQLGMNTFIETLSPFGDIPIKHCMVLTLDHCLAAVVEIDMARYDMHHIIDAASEPTNGETLEGW